MSPVNVPKADNEAIAGAPSWRRRFRLFDEEDADDPRSTIGEGDLAGIQRRYSIPESVKLRCAWEFERAPDGGLDELTPSTLRTLIAIQVLGELQGIPFGISKVLYSYSFVPLKDKKGFYQIWSRDGEPIVNEPPHGVRGGFPHDDLWNRRYVFMKVNVATGYPLFWRSIDVVRHVSFAGEASVKLAMEIPKRFRWIPFLVNQATLSHSRVWDEISYPYLAIVD
ncbi:hypothetical protein Bca101_010311 [Brassica carinata]